MLWLLEACLLLLTTQKGCARINLLIFGENILVLVKQFPFFAITVCLGLAHIFWGTWCAHVRHV